MKKIRFIGIFLAVAMLISTVGCSSNTESDDLMRNELIKAYEKEDYGFQTEMPEKGEEVAILHTNMGDICIRFFPKGAPKAVENFKTHIKNGYYDGLTFHRVANDFMIQGGDPKGDGTGGESIWGSSFEDEFCEKLVNIRGALAMANSGIDTNGSQFFINQAEKNITRDDYDYDMMVNAYSEYYDQYVQYYGNEFLSAYPDLDTYLASVMTPNPKLIPDEVWDLYEKYGGNIHLDGAWRATGGHTVFGQVYDGMDVVDAIAKVEVDSNSKPLEAIVIKKAELVKYGG